jgi:DNA replication protein DnaC
LWQLARTPRLLKNNLSNFERRGQFNNGGGGAGKSHLIKAIYHTVTKTFRHAPMNPELPSVLLMAPTGVAAININGTTVNTALAIPRECGNNVPE